MGSIGSIRSPILTKEMIKRNEEEQRPSDVKQYTLSPEELAKYRKEDEQVKKTKIPAPPKNEMINLIKKNKGNVNAIAKIKRVSWPTAKGWIEELGLIETVKEEANKHQEALRKLYSVKKLAEQKGDTPPLQEPVEDDFPPKTCDDCGGDIAEGEDIFIDTDSFEVKESLAVCPKCYKEKYMHLEKEIETRKPDLDKSGEEKSGAMIQFGIGDVMDFPNIDEALSYIENECSKKEAQKLTLYQKVPFSFGVMVSPGKVS